MRLNDEAEALRRRFLEQADPAVTERVGAGLAKLLEEHPAGHALGVGDRAPDFKRPEARGRTVQLYRRLAKGPVVLSFYRGGWCPFCSLELRAWCRHVDKLHALGAELIAVSPEAASEAAGSASSQGFGFPVVIDANQAVAESYGLVFELPKAVREAQSMLDAPLDRLNADGTWRLPVPATYLVDPKGIIRWAYADDDYTHRAEPAEVVDALRELVGPRPTASAAGNR